MDSRSWNRFVGGWLGMLVATLGAIVVVGWHLHVPAIIRLNPAWVPMRYNTALSFLALGLGLVAWSLRFFAAARVLALVPLTIGSVTLITRAADVYVDIDGFLLGVSAVPGRSAALTAFNFTLGGIALLLAPARQYPASIPITWTLGLFIAACGIAAGTLTVWWAGDAEAVRFTYMAAHTAFGMILAGGAIVALMEDARRSMPPTSRAWQLPVMAGLSVAAISMALWQALTVADNRRAQSDTRNAVTQILGALETDSASWIEAFGRVARRAEREAGTTDSGWASESQDYFRGNRWLQEIVWFNPDGSIRHRVVRNADERLPDPQLEIQPAANQEFQRALQTHAVRMFRPGEAAQPASLPLAYVFSPFGSGDSAGVLSFAARLDTLFDEAIGHTAGGYQALVSEDGQTVFTRLVLPPFVPQGNVVPERRRVTAYGRQWLLEVWPGPAVLSRMQSVLPRLTLLFGLAVSLLVAIALRYAELVRLRTNSIANARVSLEREVEERRRAEVYARTSAERARLALAELQQILNQSQDLICTFDVEGRFLVVSASARQILGYRPEEMTGRHWGEFVYREDHGETASETAELQSGKVTRDFENRLMHRSGGLVHLSWSAAWLPEAQTGYAIARDVTRRNRHDALREGQRAVLQLVATGATLEQVLREICEYIEKMDPSAFCSILLLDPDGDRVKTIAAPRLPPEYVSAVDGISIGPEAGSCGTAMWRRDLVIVADIETDPLWVRYRSLARPYGLRACWSVPIMGSDTRVLGAFAIYHLKPCHPEPYEVEMTEAAAGLASVAIERDHVQSRLLESREQLEFARRLAQLGYWEIYLDSDRAVLSADMIEMLGLNPAEEPASSYLIKLVPEASRPLLIAAREAAIKHDVPIDAETQLLLPDGSRKYVQIRGRAVRRHDGFVIKLAGTVQDITARKQVELENARLYAELEQRVQSRTRELEQSNRELEAFSYSVSHDLRAPLRAIAGFSALLQDQHMESIDPQGRHYLDRIIAGTVRMSALIDDLLELGRVNRVEIVRQPLDLSALAAAVSSRFHERWPQRVVDVEIQPDLVVWGDLRLMEVVLENLLDNAWKFTAGRIAAKVQVGKRVQNGQETFFVADNGVGFDPQYAANLFGVFQRLHAATAFPGTGVGLATVQRILQRHGGRIWADATIDKGATFYFTVSERSR